LNAESARNRSTMAVSTLDGKALDYWTGMVKQERISSTQSDS
jgi:hypothetical protein